MMKKICFSHCVTVGDPELNTEPDDAVSEEQPPTFTKRTMSKLVSAEQQAISELGEKQARKLIFSATKMQAAARGHSVRVKAKRLSREEGDKLWYGRIKPVVLEVFEQVAGDDGVMDIEEFVKWINEEWRASKVRKKAAAVAATAAATVAVTARQPVAAHTPSDAPSAGTAPAAATPEAAPTEALGSTPEAPLVMELAYDHAVAAVAAPPAMEDAAATSASVFARKTTTQEADLSGWDGVAPPEARTTRREPPQQLSNSMRAALHKLYPQAPHDFMARLTSEDHGFHSHYYRGLVTQCFEQSTDQSKMPPFSHHSSNSRPKSVAVPALPRPPRSFPRSSGTSLSLPASPCRNRYAASPQAGASLSLPYAHSHHHPCTRPNSERVQVSSKASSLPSSPGLHRHAALAGCHSPPVARLLKSQKCRSPREPPTPPSFRSQMRPVSATVRTDPISSVKSTALRWGWPLSF